MDARTATRITWIGILMGITLLLAACGGKEMQASANLSSVQGGNGNLNGGTNSSTGNNSSSTTPNQALITDPSTTTTSGTSGEPAPVCVIARAPNSALLTPGQNLMFAMVIQGEASSAEVNGVSVSPTQSFAVAPSANGNYSVLGSVTGPGGSSSCGFIFTPPGCTITPLNNVGSGATLAILFSGSISLAGGITPGGAGSVSSTTPIAQVSVNGVIQPGPLTSPMQDLISNLTPGTNYPVSVSVSTATGDVGLCTATFTEGYPPIVLSNPQQESYSGTAFSVGGEAPIAECSGDPFSTSTSDTYSALVGWGNATDCSYSVLVAASNAILGVGIPMTPSGSQCPSGMIATSVSDTTSTSGNYSTPIVQLECSQLAPGIILGPITVVKFGSGVALCPSGEVLVGAAIDANNYQIDCAPIAYVN